MILVQSLLKFFLSYSNSKIDLPTRAGLMHFLDRLYYFCAKKKTKHLYGFMYPYLILLTIFIA